MTASLSWLISLIRGVSSSIERASVGFTALSQLASPMTPPFIDK